MNSKEKILGPGGTGEEWGEQAGTNGIIFHVTSPLVLPLPFSQVSLLLLCPEPAMPHKFALLHSVRGTATSSFQDASLGLQRDGKPQGLASQAFLEGRCGRAFLLCPAIL